MDPTRVNFVLPLLRICDYQHRPEFDRLCDWWRRGGQGACALIGIGGAGKTAIADTNGRFFYASHVEHQTVESLQ